jgi:uncharacterized protein (TIGR02147 family)
MSRTRAPINLFTYLDYRTFLVEWFGAMKAAKRPVSYRAFSQRAGFRSSNFVMLVMQGKRNLSAKGIERCIRGLTLNKEEAIYFRHLAQYNQGETHDDRAVHYAQLIATRRFRERQPIRKDQYAYCSAWYHAVVRELIASPQCDGSVEWLASMIRPKVSEGDLRRSLQILEDLGLITKTAQGRWKQSATVLSTGAEVASVAMMQYHRALLALSQTALDEVPAAQRDVSAMTLGISAARIPALKRKIQAFREEILAFVANEDAPDTVVQLDIQAFPVTKLPEEPSC